MAKNASAGKAVKSVIRGASKRGVTKRHAFKPGVIPAKFYGLPVGVKGMVEVPLDKAMLSRGEALRAQRDMQRMEQRSRSARTGSKVRANVQTDPLLMGGVHQPGKKG